MPTARRALVTLALVGGVLFGHVPAADATVGTNTTSGAAACVILRPADFSACLVNPFDGLPRTPRP